jgi:hypothetical protein
MPQVFSCSTTAGDDGFQKVSRGLLNEGNKIGVSGHLDDEYLLMRMPAVRGLFEDGEQTPVCDCQDDVFESKPSMSD